MSKFNPNSELVAINYIRSLAVTPSASSGVGGTLPENKTSWVDGFIQVQIVGGTPGLYTAERQAVVQVDCWVPSINSSKPQWGKVASIASDLVEKFYALGNKGVHMSQGNFKDVNIQSAYAVAEPRKVSNDPAGHARYTMDVVINWVVAEPPSI